MWYNVYLNNQKIYLHEYFSVLLKRPLDTSRTMSFERRLLLYNDFRLYITLLDKAQLKGNEVRGIVVNSKDLMDCNLSVFVEFYVRRLNLK